MARKKINYAEMYTLRKDGRYQGYWRDADNKRHTICDRDPEKLYYKIIEKEKPKELLFRDIADAWRESASRTLRSGSYDSYTAAYNRALERLGDVAVSQIQASDIYDHLCVMAAQKYATRTIKIQRTLYSLVFRHAIIDPNFGKEVRYNPAANVPLPPGTKPAKVREAPEDDVIKKIRESVDSARFGLFPLFVLFTGMRRGEALAIQWQDIDFKKKIISCNKALDFSGNKTKLSIPKTKAGYREMPLLDELAQALLRHRPKGYSPKDFVFFEDTPSKFISNRGYLRSWEHYCIDVGFIEKTVQWKKYDKTRFCNRTIIKTTLTAHVLRHGYATILYEAGVDPYTAMRLLGHSDVQTTMSIYTHLRKKKETESLLKLEKYMASDKDSSQ